MFSNFISILFISISACLYADASAHAETETLEEAWSYAYQINPSLKAERAELRATDEAAAQAQTHWRPSIQATGNVGKTYQYLPAQKPFGTADFADTTRGYNVQVTQPIFRGWRTDSETDAAEKKILAGRAKLNDTEQQLFVDSATAFLNTLRDEAILDIQRESEHILNEKLVETNARAKFGDLTKTDVDQAEARLERSHVARLQAESTLANDRSSYLRLVGHMPEKLKAPILNVDASQNRDDILDLADTHNPKVIAAQYDMEEAKEEISLNKGALLPELDIVGNTGKNWGQSSTLPGRFDSSQVLLQLTIPLYDSGSTYSKSRAAEQVATQKRMVLEEARHKAHELAENAWESLRESDAALKADNAEVESAARAYEGVKIQSKIGTRTTLDVLNAEQEWLDAKVDSLKSKHDRDLSVIQIAAAIGQLTVDNLTLPVEHYDPERHLQDVRHQWIGFSKDDVHYDPCASEDVSACKTKPKDLNIKPDASSLSEDTLVSDNTSAAESQKSHTVMSYTKEAAP